MLNMVKFSMSMVVIGLYDGAVAINMESPPGGAPLSENDQKEEIMDQKENDLRSVAMLFSESELKAIKISIESDVEKWRRDWRKFADDARALTAEQFSENYEAIIKRDKELQDRSAELMKRQKMFLKMCENSKIVLRLMKGSRKTQ
jgi:hypothetical protein